MRLELDTPSDIYQQINHELNGIARLLTDESDDEELSQAHAEAQLILDQHRAKLQKQLLELEQSAEWNTFTIGFYGETGAGKSTVIETLRILLGEPTKLASQKKFRELQNKHGLTKGRLLQLQQDIDLADSRLQQLELELQKSVERQQQRQKNAMDLIATLRARILDRKQTASLWQKLLNLFKKMTEEVELGRLEEQLPYINEEGERATNSLATQKSEDKARKLALEEELSACQQHLMQLQELADGEIIGDGRTDFTRQTQRYDFAIDNKPFALLDVPGIEGSEGEIYSEIERAVKTAHAVFYVTNQAAPPQTGDEKGKGTLEKIKQHLGAQTEVWAIFNKKVTNPKYALTDRPLVSEDEEEGLAGLNEKMREQLGDHYKDVFSLTALPAFLVSTDHFAPNSKNANRRIKVSSQFEPEVLLEKSRFQAFIQFLRNNLLEDSEKKITRANFHKAKEALDDSSETLEEIQSSFSELSDKLSLESKSAQAQLAGSFASLKHRLQSAGEILIDQFSSDVLNKTYERIGDEISNDRFKEVFKNQLKLRQEQLSKQLPDAMAGEIEHFKKDAESIIKRFEEQSRELTEIYAKLSSTNLDRDFSLKLDIDNGLNVTNLLAVMAGGVLLWWNPAGWFVLAMGAVSIAVGAYKAVRGFFSADYQKAQQRKSADENLRTITKQLRESLHESLKKALPEMEQTIYKLESAIEAPAKQIRARVSTLERSATQMNALSKLIVDTGRL